MSLKIYTDGSCIFKKLASGRMSKDGVCGWAYAVIDCDFILCDSGGEKKSTNNRMEMQAVIEALLFITKNYNNRYDLEIFCDSKLVINCAQGIWQRKSNLDLWENYDKVVVLLVGKKIRWHKVKSHSGIYMNDLVDEMARKEARRYF